MSATTDSLWDDLDRLDAAGDKAGAEKVASQLRAIETSRIASEKFDTKLKAGEYNPDNPLAGESKWSRAWAGAGAGTKESMLGYRQAAADINRLEGVPGVEEKVAKLKEEAAALAKANQRINEDAWGGFGNITGKLIPELLPFSKMARGIEAGANMIPWVRRANELRAAGEKAPLLPRAIAPLATGATTGAIIGASTPSEDYSLPEDAAWGSMLGIPGELAGRLIGRALRPMQAPGTAAVEEQKRALVRQPNLIAEHLTDDSTVRSVTNALGQLPGVSGIVKGSRDRVLGDLTEGAGSDVGRPNMRVLTEEAKAAIEREEAARYAQHRSGPPVPLSLIPPAIQPALDTAINVARMSRGGTSAGVRSLESAAEASTPQTSLVLNARGQPQLSTTPATMPIGDLIDARIVASKAARDATDPVTRAPHLAVRNAIDDALRQHMGSDEFNRYQATQLFHGSKNDLFDSVNKSTGRIDPQAWVTKLLDGENRAARTPLEHEAVAAAARIKPPPGTENRAVIAGLLLGGGLAGGSTGYSQSGDSPLTGTAVGTALGATLTPLVTAGLLATPMGSRYLTGNARSMFGRGMQSAEAKRIATLLGMTGLPHGADYIPGARELKEYFKE